MQTINILFEFIGYNDLYVCTVVSRIYAPRFATFLLVESVGGGGEGGGLYVGSDTYLTNTPPLPVPRLDVDIGIYYRPVEATDLPSLLILLSQSPELQKLDGQDRLTEAGHSVDSGFVLSMCC